MLRLLLIILSLFIALSADAQNLWTELTAAEQRTTIASRRTHELVREVMISPVPFKELDSETRTRLIARITSHCNDENVAALYLYIYNALREPNASMAEYDVRMLSMHPSLVLKLWASDSSYGELYNWAYSLGCQHARMGHSSVKRALSKLTKKNLLLEYGTIINRFASAYTIAYESVSAGINALKDITPLAPLDERFSISSKKEYEAVSAIAKPLVMPLGDASSEAENAMRRECMTWDGAYHTLIKHNLMRGISLIRSSSSGVEYLSFVDLKGDKYTVENQVYMLDNGLFVALRTSSSPHGIVIGRILQRGGIVLLGERSLDYGITIRGVKCAGHSVYLCVDSEDFGEQYLNFTIR